MNDARQESVWGQMAAIARRDARIQLSYKFDLLLQVEGVAFGVTVTYFIARLVPDVRLRPYAGGYFEFALIGLAASLLAGVGLAAFTSSIDRAQAEGTLEILLATPSRLSTLLIGSLIVPLTLATIQVLGAFCVGLMFGARLDLGGAALAVPVFALTITSFGGLGLLSAAFIILAKRGSLISVAVTQATSLLGGALFPVGLMPIWARAAARLVPSYYALNGLRGALIGNAGVGETLRHAGALVAFTAVLVPLGLWCFARALRLARVAGTLGTY